ncbi:DUF1109 domain-containing protein [Sphingomonas antarctica]|uniref:DUF1109 domain-containing protein n=1 Tax=Sphingomonas antarctica TaxID=2040274 RepID=UPI0039EA5B45
MNTDDLITSLAAHAVPVRRGWIVRRIAVGAGLGALGTLAMITVQLGFRPDLMVAMHGFAFWMKWTYTISLGVIALLAVAHLARPEATSPRWLWLLAVPVAALAALATGELIRTPTADWPALWMGLSWKMCSTRVATLSLPIFIGLVIAFRRLAPTRLRLTGAVAGLAAGACGATLYCLHCPEVSAVFVLTWYTLGIAVAAGIGALIGPRLLRW